MFLLLFQNIPVADATQLLTIEKVSVVGILLAAIVVLIYQNKGIKRERDTAQSKLHELVSEHHKIQREDKKDIVAMVSRYQNLVERLIDRPRERPQA